MTIPASVSHSQTHLRRRGHAQSHGSLSDGSRLLIMTISLACACLWPLFFMGMFGFFGSTTSRSNLSTGEGPGSTLQLSDSINPGLSFRKYLDRVDIMGYGPTHPRVAVVVIGQSGDASKVKSTVASVFGYVHHFCSYICSACPHPRVASLTLLTIVERASTRLLLHCYQFDMVLATPI